MVHIIHLSGRTPPPVPDRSAGHKPNTLLHHRNSIPLAGDSVLNERQDAQSSCRQRAGIENYRCPRRRSSRGRFVASADRSSFDWRELRADAALPESQARLRTLLRPAFSVMRLPQRLWPIRTVSSVSRHCYTLRPRIWILQLHDNINKSFTEIFTGAPRRKAVRRSARGDKQIRFS